MHWRKKRWWNNFHSEIYVYFTNNYKVTHWIKHENLKYKNWNNFYIVKHITINIKKIIQCTFLKLKYFLLSVLIFKFVSKNISQPLASLLTDSLIERDAWWVLKFVCFLPQPFFSVLSSHAAPNLKQQSLFYCIDSQIVLNSHQRWTTSLI